MNWVLFVNTCWSREVLTEPPVHPINMWYHTEKKDGGRSMKLLLNILGILVVLAVAWLLSWDRKTIPWKTVVRGIVVEFALLSYW